MIVIRNVFQAKVGQADTLAKVMAEGMRGSSGTTTRPAAWRVLTDISGPFDTVVLEVETESLAAWEAAWPEMAASPEFRDTWARGAELIVSGSRGIYTIEEHG